MQTGRPAPTHGRERRFHEDPRLDAAVREMASAFARSGRDPGRRVGPTPPVLTREVATEQGTFFVTCVNYMEWPPAGDVLVVTVTEPRRAELPNESELRKWYGLTRMEARVARLLALGMTNAEIATSQFISAHTARHHTESVLLKLGVHSRREVARLLERTGRIEEAA